MSEKKMWMVRAGEDAYAVEDFRTKGMVGIGWSEDETDWTQFSNRDAIQAKLAQAHPDNTEGQNFAAANQIERFLREFAIGDRVVTYDPTTRKYLIGTITSGPKYNPSLVADLPNSRAVAWQGEVSRDELSVPTRNSLGSISTLFRVPEAAAAEMEAKLVGSSAPTVNVVDPIKDEADLLKDVQGRSHEFIKDRISKLDWEQMQLLVAGLLRAMGYKTRISPMGADRGKDIIASPDGF
jgi:restriction system protein